MVKRYNTDDLDDGEERAELVAAFGEGADLVELEIGDLEPVPKKEWPMADALEEGDWVTIQHRAGNVTTGPVTEVGSVGFHMEPRNRVGAGYFAYSSFGGERGARNELLDIDGSPADVEYEPEIVGDWEGAEGGE